MTRASWHDLVIALGVPLLLLLAGVLALERWGASLPPWLRWVHRYRGRLWNGGVGLLIGLSLLRWWLHR